MSGNMIPLRHLWTRSSKNTVSAAPHTYRPIGTNKARASAWHTFTRAVSLKILLVWIYQKYGKTHRHQEAEKVLVSTTRKIALARLAVHLPPAIITVFLILWNTIEYLNGPQITAPATFGLQVLAKLHELTITGSLTLIVLDVIRHELLQGGINLGLLSSSFEVTGLNFLYSPNFLSVLFTDYAWQKRLFLFSLILICCVMTSVVGPASALLFIPTEVWKPYGWTQFYLGGSNESRWPTELTAEHIGPQACHNDNTRFLMMVCPAGGYNTIFPRLIKPPEVVFDIPVHDARYTRLIHGRTPWLDRNVTENQTPETWAVTSRADVSFMMQDLSYKYSDAQTVATGRRRRLRDFVDGRYILSESNLPVGRTVCGPPQIIYPNTTSLSFPILAPDRQWRNLSTASPGGFWGPTREHDVEGMGVVRVREGKETQASAKWVQLGPEFGAATAGLAVVSQNMDLTVAKGCTLDFRWATGQVYRVSDSLMGSFEAEIGSQHPPSNSQNQYTRYEATDFFDPNITPYLGPTITASQDYLDAIFPVYMNTTDPKGYNMTTLEFMIDSTTASYPDFVIEKTTQRAMTASTQLEMIISVAFVDVLARTGWYESLKYPDDSMMINPTLQQYASSDPQLLMKGGPVYTPPTNMSYGTVNVNWYAYGVAWTMREKDQSLSVAVLGFALVLALIHVAWTLWRPRSMEAWDSIAELLVLAWNSEPTRRENELKNCSVGIHGMEPMKYKVKAMMIKKDDEEADGGSEGRVELVIVDDNAVNKDGRKAEDIQYDKKYR